MDLPVAEKGTSLPLAIDFPFLLCMSASGQFFR